MQNGVKPNVRTYTALITALGNGKQWSRALKTLEAMKHDTSGNHVEPNAYTYSALLKALGEHGQWGMAEKVPLPLCLCDSVRLCDLSILLGSLSLNANPAEGC